jgi:hypothetical protein
MKNKGKYDKIDWKGAMFECRDCAHRHFDKDTKTGWFCDAEICDYEEVSE